MKCRNCLKEIPDGAKSCQYCEAKQDDTPLTSRREMEEMLDVTDPGLKTHLQILAASSETAEDFANAIMCPSCPACGSGRTETCGKVRGIENDEVGRCGDSLVDGIVGGCIAGMKGDEDVGFGAEMLVNGSLLEKQDRWQRK